VDLELGYLLGSLGLIDMVIEMDRMIYRYLEENTRYCERCSSLLTIDAAIIPPADIVVPRDNGFESVEVKEMSDMSLREIRTVFISVVTGTIIAVATWAFFIAPVAGNV
jgi:hypothetical protein